MTEEKTMDGVLHLAHNELVSQIRHHKDEGNSWLAEEDGSNGNGNSLRDLSEDEIYEVARSFLNVMLITNVRRLYVIRNEVDDGMREIGIGFEDEEWIPIHDAYMEGERI